MYSMETESNSLNTVNGENEIMASHYINPQDIWNLFYTIFDGNEYACAGAMGNMQWESGLYTDNAENLWNQRTGHSDEWLTTNINNGTISLSEFLQRSWWVNSVGFGYGLSQWTDSARRTKLWEFTIGNGLPIDSQEGQFNYIRWEWLNSDSYYHQFLSPMKSMSSISQATYYYLQHYEVGRWNSKRLEYAENWYSTFAHGYTGQYKIYCSATGNGRCYAIPSSHDAISGETFTVYAIPYDGDTLIDLTAHEEHGTSVAIVVAEEHTYDATNFPYDIWFEATFSGETPPPPPEPPPIVKPHRMPIWMYPVLKNRRI